MDGISYFLGYFLILARRGRLLMQKGMSYIYLLEESKLTTSDYLAIEVKYKAKLKEIS